MVLPGAMPIGGVFSQPAASIEPTGSWSIMSTPTPGGPDGTTDLYGVSCTSADFCVAVGCFYTIGVGSCPPPAAEQVNTLAEEWNGSNWSTMTTANPSNPDSNNVLYAVSCISPDFCIAVGTMTTESDGSQLRGQALTEEWDGSTWSTMTTPNPGSTNWLSAVSCVSPTFCVAVGPDATDDESLAELWNGSNWSAMSTTDPSDNGDSLAAVSCTSSSFCLAVGSDDDANSGPTIGETGQTLGEEWNGVSWSTMNTANLGAGSGLWAVSCPSTGFCVAAGENGSPAPNDLFTEQWSGGGWSMMTMPNSSMIGGGTDGLIGMSCSSPSFCLTVVPGMAMQWDGSSWSTTSTPNGDGYLYGASCPSANFCIAVGFNGWSQPDAASYQGDD